MKMAFVLFDGMTSLDFIGFHTTVTWLKRLGHMEELSWDMCGLTTEIVDDRAMKIVVDVVKPDLANYDLVFIPGGMATRTLIHDVQFMGWIATASSVTFKVSVCTGSLIWGAAGMIRDKKVTTNPNAFDLVRPYCAELIEARATHDGTVYTGGGIAASVDLGLYFIERIITPQIADKVAKHMDYPYYRISKHY